MSIRLIKQIMKNSKYDVNITNSYPWAFAYTRLLNSCHPGTSNHHYSRLYCWPPCNPFYNRQAERPTAVVKAHPIPNGPPPPHTVSVSPPSPHGRQLPTAVPPPPPPLHTVSRSPRTTRQHGNTDDSHMHSWYPKSSFRFAMSAIAFHCARACPVRYVNSISVYRDPLEIVFFFQL